MRMSSVMSEQMKERENAKIMSCIKSVMVLMSIENWSRDLTEYVIR